MESCVSVLQALNENRKKTGPSEVSLDLIAANRGVDCQYIYTITSHLG